MCATGVLLRDVLCCIYPLPSCLVVADAYAYSLTVSSSGLSTPCFLLFVKTAKALPEPREEALYEAELVNLGLLRAYPRSSPEVLGLVEVKGVVSEGLGSENISLLLGSSTPIDFVRQSSGELDGPHGSGGRDGHH